MLSLFTGRSDELAGRPCEEVRRRLGLGGELLRRPWGSRLRACCWWAFWNAVRRLPLPRAKAMPACMFWPREAFDEFGPFDERVAIGEEWPILAGLYRARPRRFVYDQAITALSSGRRMELQNFCHMRTFARYVWAIRNADPGPWEQLRDRLARRALHFPPLHLAQACPPDGRRRELESLLLRGAWRCGSLMENADDWSIG
jgi:hypothetical protein